MQGGAANKHPNSFEGRAVRETTWEQGGNLGGKRPGSREATWEGNDLGAGRQPKREATREQGDNLGRRLNWNREETWE